MIAPDVGGGFGPKAVLYPEQFAIPACALLTGRAVKWIEDRREHFLTTYQERDQYWRGELAISADGRLLGLRGHLLHDAGAYLPWGVVVPQHGVTLAELARFASGVPGFAMPRGLGAGLEDTTYFTPERASYPNGCHVAEVEVDVETGQVHVLNYVTGHDCGTIINPMSVEGQVQGGVAHGIGNALFEWMRYDDNADVHRKALVDMVYSCREVDAHTALAIGLAGRVSAPGALDGELEALLATLAGYDEHAVRYIKGFAGKRGHVDPQTLSDLAGYTLATAFTRPR